MSRPHLSTRPRSLSPPTNHHPVPTRKAHPVDPHEPAGIEPGFFGVSRDDERAQPACTDDGLAEIMAGVLAVIPTNPPPIVVTSGVGTARWNREHRRIEVDPKILTWPAECRQFIGAHEAAHVGQKSTPPWWTVNAILSIGILYALLYLAGPLRFGFSDALAQFSADMTACLCLTLVLIIEGVLHLSRRTEYQADQIAAAALGTDGIQRWRTIAEQQMTRPIRTVLAINAHTGLRTHPSWSRRIAAVQRAHNLRTQAVPAAPR